MSNDSKVRLLQEASESASHRRQRCPVQLNGAVSAMPCHPNRAPRHQVLNCSAQLDPKAMVKSRFGGLLFSKYPDHRNEAVCFVSSRLILLDPGLRARLVATLFGPSSSGRGDHSAGWPNPGTLSEAPCRSPESGFPSECGATPTTAKSQRLWLFNHRSWRSMTTKYWPKKGVHR